MHGVAGAQVDHHSPLYVRLTRVHEARTPERCTATTCIPLTTLVAADLATGEGTPEYQAWIHRTAQRLGLTNGAPQ